jgi:hypothetical protein
MKGEFSMNKLMARIVAVVMAVMMLGTVSFAATTLSETNDVITPEIGDLTSGIYTVKAYTDTTNTIVAMYQGAKPGSVKIDPAKIAETDNNVVVEFNGKGGTKTNVSLPVTRTPDDVVATTTVSDTYEFDGNTYTGVAHVSNEFNLGGKVATAIGYILKATGGSATGVENRVAYEGTLSGGGDIEFDVVVLKVPEDVTISAQYFIEY